jgi:hypothetical protein
MTPSPSSFPMTPDPFCFPGSCHFWHWAYSPGRAGPRPGRLIRVGRARSAESPSYSRPTWMQVFGTVIAAFTLLVLFVVSSVIAFVVVCAPIGFNSFNRNFENPHPDDFAGGVFVLSGLVLGVLAAATVPYLIALRLFRKDAGPRMDPREAAAARRLQGRRTAIAILILCGALALAYGAGLPLAIALTPALFHLFRIESPPIFEDRHTGSLGRASWARAVGEAFATVAFTGILVMGVSYAFQDFASRAIFDLYAIGLPLSYSDNTALIVAMIPGMIVGGRSRLHHGPIRASPHLTRYRGTPSTKTLVRSAAELRRMRYPVVMSRAVRRVDAICRRLESLPRHCGPP